MKSSLRVVVAAGLLTLVPFAALAQTQPQQKPTEAQVREAAALTRAQLQSDRQAVVAANLPLNGEQAAAFWPVYREYRNEMQKLGDRSLALIVDYAKSFESMTDEQATKLIDDYLSIEKDMVKVRSDWAPKFRKILPATAVLRFYQIENKIDAILKFDAADQVPLVQLKK